MGTSTEKSPWAFDSRSGRGPHHDMARLGLLDAGLEGGEVGLPEHLPAHIGIKSVPRGRQVLDIIRREMLAAHAYQEGPTFPHRLVRRVRLGSGDEGDSKACSEKRILPEALLQGADAWG